MSLDPDRSGTVPDLDRRRLFCANVSATLLTEKLLQSRAANLAKVAALMREYASHLGDFITNNGVGISPQNITRIFNLGFTTRPGGHGFGLHSGALAVGEMGGTLVSQSNGPGLGATFTLELPLSPRA